MPGLWWTRHFYFYLIVEKAAGSEFQTVEQTPDQVLLPLVTSQWVLEGHTS